MGRRIITYTLSESTTKCRIIIKSHAFAGDSSEKDIFKTVSQKGNQSVARGNTRANPDLPHLENPYSVSKVFLPR